MLLRAKELEAAENWDSHPFHDPWVPSAPPPPARAPAATIHAGGVPGLGNRHYGTVVSSGRDAGLGPADASQQIAFARPPLPPMPLLVSSVVSCRHVVRLLLVFNLVSVLPGGLVGHGPFSALR